MTSKYDNSTFEGRFIKKDEVKALKDIGHGSFGNVSLIYHKKWKETLAAKTIRPDNDPQYREKFFWESDKMLKCRHDCIVDIRGVIIHEEESHPDQPVFCIVMPYYCFGSIKKLAEVLAKGTVEFPLKFRWMYETALGMLYLHANDILHMDLKTANVLVTNELHIKICDFGLSRWAVGHSSEEENRKIGGTVSHMPPEAFGRPDQAPQKSFKFDVYSYGVFLWEVIGEETPFKDAQNQGVVIHGIQNNIRPDMEVLEADEIVASLGQHEASREAYTAAKTLLQECWKMEPESRPSFEDVVDTLIPLHKKTEDVAVSMVHDVTQKLNDTLKGSSTQQSGNNYPENVNMATIMSQQLQGIPPRQPRAPAQMNGGPSESIANVVIKKAGNIYIGGGDADDYCDWAEENPDLETHGIKLAEMYETVSDAHLMQLAFHIGRRWKVLGRCLKFTDGELDVFLHDNHFDGLHEVIYQMLRKWREEHGVQATREWIACACIFIGKKELIKLLSDDKKLF